MTGAGEYVWNKNELALVENHSGARRKHVVLEGGSGSGKTWSVCRYFASWCMQEPGLRVGFFRFDGARHVDGALADFSQILPAMGLTDAEAKIVNRPSEIHFSNGSIIAFRGVQDQNKSEGPRWDACYFNEIVEIPYSSFANVSQRTRLFVIADFNPKVSLHWIYDKLLKGSRDDVLHVRSTQLDNVYLSDGERATIRGYEPTPVNVARGTADLWRWQVYGLGLRARREGLVYPQWHITDKWPDPHLCERHGYGLDFGFANDPAALIECSIWNSCLYVRQRIYETGLIVGKSASNPSAPSIQGILDELKIPSHARIHADCAAAESIRVLQLAGYNVVPCVKRQTEDGELYGLDRVRSFAIHVHEDSIDVLRELENYTWAVERGSGRFLARPIDAWNHALDAVRYWTIAEAKPRRDPTAPPRPGGAARTTLARW